MPAKNSVKIFDENGYYHLYNRGVEKRLIFLDDQDYGVFLSYLKFYLSSEDETSEVFPSQKLKNYSDSIDLLSYCLMPNHFHFEVKQYHERTITEFIRSLLTRYSMYFNKKYKRVGSLFQGRYKAVKVESENQLIYLSKYIHRNPIELTPSLFDHRYSSLRNYLGRISQDWVKPGPIINLFSQNNPNLTYQSFVFDLDELGDIHSLTIDNET